MLNPSGLEVRIGNKGGRLLTEYGLQRFPSDGGQDEQEAALFKGHVRSQSVDVGGLQDNDITVGQSPMTTQQYASRECDRAEATTRDADNLVGPEESRLPAAELEGHRISRAADQ